jgi:ubiquinone biosynthesis protein
MPSATPSSSNPASPESASVGRRPWQESSDEPNALEAAFIIFWRWSVVGWLFWMAVLHWLWASLALRAGWIHNDPRPFLLRQFLERASGTWIKLGQILAMRIDFIPPPFIEELSNLFENVPPFPFEAARRIVESDLGRPIEEIFTVFPEKTIAAASFGQVYRAVLRSGQEAAVKVMRPGLSTVIKADLIQLRILGFFSDTFGLLGSIQLKPQITQLERILREEIDYGIEADHIRRAVATSRYYRIMHVPRVYDDYSSSRVLTMEFLSGTWMTEILSAIRDHNEEELAVFRSRGINFTLLAERIFEIGMRQIFEVGSFHADPHAGNIVIQSNNVVGYVDFGIVGEMDDTLRDLQERYFLAVKDRKVSEAARALGEMAVVPSNSSRQLDEFRTEAAALVQKWLDHVDNSKSSLREKGSAQLLLSNVALIRKHSFSLMENTMRYYRALIIADVIILQLDPNFDAVRHLKRYFIRRQIRRTRVEMSPHAVLATTAEYFHLWFQGPGMIRQVNRFLLNNEDQMTEVTSRLDIFYKNMARLSLAALLLVLGARLFGIHDVGKLVAFPIVLDWRWVSPLLLLFWRGCASFNRYPA